jgi:hypothetical protein
MSTIFLAISHPWLVMAIVGRSGHRCWWVSLLPIAGLMLATANASPCEVGGKGSRAVAHANALGGPTALVKGLPVFAKEQGAPTGQHTEARPAQVSSGSRIAGRICRSRTQPTPTPSVKDAVAKSHNVGTAAAARLLPHTHMRVTRLQNGTILCCRQVPSLRIVVVPWDANDDTASDGDDSSDDDDSRDDLSGDDDRDTPIIAWLDAMVPYVIVPECTRRGLLSIVSTSLPAFPTLERLRC